MTAEQPAAAAILLDANLLLWAHHRQFAQHGLARAWLAETLSTVPVVGIPWPSILTFVRISTHLARSSGHSTRRRPRGGRGLASAAEREHARTTDRHAALFGDLFVGGRATGNHTTDAHLAALAVEWGLVLVSADRDFARYPGLRWHDPSAGW